MRLLLIGDIHAYRTAVPPWHLAGKPLFGQLNLLLRRRRKFDLSLLPRIIQRAVALRPDLVLLTGDLTTTALAAEFADVAAALQPLLAVAPAAAIPGNHDRYTFSSTFARYFERALPGIVPTRFPSLRPINQIARVTTPPTSGDTSGDTSGGITSGAWHLLMLNASRPTLASSRGRLGRRQLAAARQSLSTLSAQDGLLVMCHYSLGKPPDLHPSPWHHLLADAAELTDLLASFPGRLLFLHGHVHRPWLWPRPEPALRRVLDVNAGAPCYLAKDYPRGQGFWEIDLPTQVQDTIHFHHHQMMPAATGSAESDWVVRSTSIDPVV